MPVTFYPEKPVNLLDNLIVKKDGSPLYGEIDIYKQLYYSCTNSELDWHIWHDLRLPFHSVNSNPLNKSEAQIDFLVLCEHGLMVIEVKGGKVFYSNRSFYSDSNLKNSLPQNPIDQANGYKITLIEEALSLDKRVFISYCIAFPHSTFNVQSEIIDSNIFWAKNKFDSYDKIDNIPDISKFLISVFKKKKEGMAIHKKHYGRLYEDQIQKTIRIFSPTSIPTNLDFYSSILEWLCVENLDLYECIRSNRRIMVEGGPGSGKTTFALAFINERREKKGLFICWNRLLKAKIKKKLYYRDLHNCKVVGFAGVALNNLDKFIDEKYDYIVIDEGQDLFNRGIDQFIEKVLDNGSGLTFGNILLLYDIDQSYSRKSTDVRDYEYLLRDYFAYFKLTDNKRSAQFPDIKSIASKIINGKLSTFKSIAAENMSGIILEYFNSKKRLLHFIRNNIQQKLKDANDECTGMNSVILIESSVYNSNIDNNGLEIDLIDLSNLSELNEENIGIEDNTLNYTTPLKYKGLESKFVFLICKDISDLNYYELYVGITRAIFQVQILIIDD